MHDVINNFYHIVSLQMEKGNVPDRSKNISVSIRLQNVIDRFGTDQKALRYNGNIVLFITKKNMFTNLSILFICFCLHNETEKIYLEHVICKLM